MWTLPFAVTSVGLSLMTKTNKAKNEENYLPIMIEFVAGADDSIQVISDGCRAWIRLYFHDYGFSTRFPATK